MTGYPEQDRFAQWTPAAIKAETKTEHGRAKLAQLAAEGSSDFVSHSETMIFGKQRPQPGRASKVALDIMKRFPGGESALAENALETGFATGGLLERVAARCAAKASERAVVIRLRRAAIALEPKQAHRYLALARTLRSESTTGVVHDPLVGLIQGPVEAHTQEIVELFEKARQLAPSSTYIAYELGLALLGSGRPYEGLLLLERASLRNPDAEWLMELAQSYRRPDIARFEDAFDAYEDVISKTPQSSKALAGLIHTGARGPMDWPRIWRTVRKVERSRKASPYNGNEHLQERLDNLFEGGGPEPEKVSTLVRALEHESGRGRDLSSHALNLVILRLQFLGHFSYGFQLRVQSANIRKAALRRSGIKSVSGLRRLMKALVYLDRYDLAQRISADADYWAQGESSARTAVQKLHADASLMNGQVEPYLQYSEEVRNVFSLRAESRMQELIEGKRIALVGPAATKEQLGETIDDYDVVVRPNFKPELIRNNPTSMGSRTDIAYYSGQDMTKLIDDVESLVEATGVQIVNTRSFSYQAHHHRQIPWLRFSRHDWSLSFHGSPLGIQRMIYDLLQFSPKEIGIFNSDFYTGDGEFTDGYRAERSFGPGSFKNDLVVVHDLLMDFKFTQAMLRTGRVHAHGRASEVLAMDPGEYTRVLEQAGVLR